MDAMMLFPFLYVASVLLECLSFCWLGYFFFLSEEEEEEEETKNFQKNDLNVSDNSLLHRLEFSFAQA